MTRLIDRIDARIDKPADQTVLTNPRGGSERMIEAADSDQAASAAKDVRRNRASSRHRWLGH
jgi:hypothetical protein